MDGWTLAYDHFDADAQGTREALCALGNGYFVCRGTDEEAAAGEVHYPGTYLAGGYNRLQTRVADRMVENEDLVNWPNWLCLSIRPDSGPWFVPGPATLLDYRLRLDLKAGVLWRELRTRDPGGRITRVTSRRLVSMANPHLAAIEYRILPENWSGRLSVRSALDGTVANTGIPRYRSLAHQHLRLLEAGRDGSDAVWLHVETTQSRIRVAQAARTRLFIDGAEFLPPREPADDGGYIGDVLTFDAQQGQETVVEKVVALYSSRDNAICEPSLDAREAVAAAGDFATLLAAQYSAWQRLWERCDVIVENTTDDTQMLLRLHIFHLLQTTSMHSIDMDVGVPARGLHGEAYRGHIFWDELYIFPFLNWRMPDVTRALLHYRYRRLPAARAAARAAGYAGAMYPWQSGSNGREETQTLHLNPMSGNWLPDNSQRQRHVNIAIAYNTWQYFAATDDRAFLAAQGAEMILEIARFLASLCAFDAAEQRYRIAGVMGPDEYHDGYPDADPPAGIDDNAYTNVMTAWVLSRALDILKHTLPQTRVERIAARIGLAPEEPQLWDRISRRLYVPFHDDGIISQFAGYADLRELDWDAYRAKYGNIRRLDRILESEGDTPNAYKLSKQADLVMLFYLLSAEELTGLMERLGYPFKPDDIPRIVRYYMARTAHGSTLSGVVHAWVLARSVRTESWPFFLEALQADHMDIQGGTTREGIHLGAMAGTVDLVQRGYSGLELRDGILWFNPVLPTELRDLRLRLLIRGAELALEIADDTITLSSLDRLNPTLRVGYRDRVLDLHPGETLDFRVYCAPAPVS